MTSRKPTTVASGNVVNRQAQMTAQEQLIENKKREIEQKLLSQKMQEQEETLSKMKKHEASKPVTKFATSRGYV